MSEISLKFFTWVQFQKQDINNIRGKLEYWLGNLGLRTNGPEHSFLNLRSLFEFPML